MLLRFRDLADGRLIWEPPDGVIDPGESPVDAARGELSEESGLPGSSIAGSPLVLWRSFRFNGRVHHQPEHFYLARVDSADLDLSHLPPDEVQWLQGHRWWTPDDLDSDSSYGNGGPTTLSHSPRSMRSLSSPSI